MMNFLLRFSVVAGILASHAASAGKLEMTVQHYFGIAEVRILGRPGKATYNSAMYMRVDNGHLTVSDTRSLQDAKCYTGTVAVSGPEWNWNFLNFSTTWLKDQSKVQDVHFITATQLIARKQQFNLKKII